MNCQDFRVGGLEQSEALELMTAAKSASFFHVFHRFFQKHQVDSGTVVVCGLVVVSGSLISMRCPHIPQVFVVE